MKNLLVSVSGGETSLYMAHWLLKNKLKEYNMLFAFSNTSKENEETLEFLDYCDKKFGLNIVWIETKFDDKKRIGYKITDFENAKRKGEVFEKMIQCYGLPNKKYPHCNRELKTEPLQRLAKDIFGKDYYTAIGIRSDEIDRVSKNRVKNKLYYPFVEDIYITKQHVNLFWKNQDRRLNLKGYEGNCNKCWKKSFRKLMTIESEEKKHDLWWDEMEMKYGEFVPSHRNRKPLEDGYRLTFYRNNNSYKDIIEMSKEDFKKATDDSVNYNIQDKLFGLNLDEIDGCSDSCEPFN